MTGKIVISVALLANLVFAASAPAQITIRGLGGRGRVDIPRTKNIHGIVRDSKGNPIPGARIIVRNTKDNTSRIAASDERGNYAFTGLPPDVDYEVRADYQGQISDRQLVTALLDREDNLVNFTLNVTMPVKAVADTGPELRTFDLVQLRASFDIPRGVQAPIPAVLLLHGFGEDRQVWDGFKSQLLDRGFAVMALDLRGHGNSRIRNQRPLEALEEWRTSPDAFPHDVGPALDFLKSQARLDSRRIAVIGYDVGANLALFASGRFKEVRTVVAVQPNLNESMAIAGSAQDFHPRSALVLTSNVDEGERLQALVAMPSRLLTMASPGGTAAWFQNQQALDAVFAWLKETY